MVGYVERARAEQDQQTSRDLDNLEKEWESNWGISELEKMTGGENRKVVSLRDLINLQNSSEHNQKRFFSVGLFLLGVSRLIIKLEVMELDEDCTVSEALAALKVKAQKSEVQPETKGDVKDPEFSLDGPERFRG